jgi:murein lipoprotein
MKSLNYIFAASTLLILTGCATPAGPDPETLAQVEQLNEQIAALDSQISSLQSEVDSLKMMDDKNTMAIEKTISALDNAKEASMIATDEAARANDRLDNLAQSYTK